MANSDKIWLDWGVRGDVEATVLNVLKNVQNIQDALTKLSETQKTSFENAAKLEITYDKIVNALNKIKNAKTLTNDKSQLDELDRMRASLESMLKSFEKLTDKRKKGKLLEEKDIVTLNQFITGFQLAITNVDRLTKSIEDNARTESRNARNQIRNLDTVKDRYYQLKRLRREMSDNIADASSRGIDVTSARNAMLQVQGKMGYLRKVISNNGTIADNYFGADFKEWLRGVGEENSKLVGKIKDREKAQNDVTAAVRQSVQANNSLIASYDKISQSGGKVNRILAQMGYQFNSYISLYGIERLLQNVIKIGGEFEVQHIALKSILGDVEQANSIFNQMKQLAVVSPFNFKQLADYSKQVAAFGIPYNEMYDTTKRLADMAAGLGVDMGRLILAFGQVRSAAVLRGQELRQFTEAGIPMVQALANEFSKLNKRAVTTGEVFELISKRAVPFEMVKKVMWDMTNEGGRFYNMQFVLSDTLAGKWSNLVDAWQIMLSQFAKGESMGGRFLKGLVQNVTDLLESMDRLSPIIGAFLASIAGHKIFSATENVFSSYFSLENIDRNIKKTQELYAVELKRRYLGGEITQEAYKQGLALNRNKQHYYMLLAQEGRLKEYQIAKAIQQKKINTERLHERVLSKEITMREAAQLRLWKIKYAQASIFSLKMREISLSIKSMLGPLGWISLAFDAAAAVITRAYLDAQRTSDALKEASDTYSHSAKDRKNELGESLAGYTANPPKNNNEYVGAISAIKDQLKQYDANYDSIMKEVDGIDTLKGKYEKLVEELGYVKEGYDIAAESRGKFNELQEKTKSLSDNASLWTTANNELNRSLTDLAARGSVDAERAMTKLAAIMPKMREAFFDDEGKRFKTGDILRNFADSLNFEEISDLLAAVRGRSAGYNNNNIALYKSIFEVMDEEDRDKFESYFEHAQERSLKMQAIDGDIENIVENTYTIVAEKLGTTTEKLKDEVKKNGNNLNQQTKTLLRNSFRQQMSAITQGNQELMDWVDRQRWTLYFHYDIVRDYTEKAGSLNGMARTAWNRWNQKLPAGVEHKGFSEKDLKDAFGEGGNDAQNAKKVLSSRLKEQEGIVVALQTAKDATKEQKDEAQSLFNDMQSDWSDIFSDDWRNLDKQGNQKKGKGNKTDQLAKDLREQIKLIKDAYSWYKKYKDDLQWSPEGAFAEVQTKYGDTLNKLGISWDADKGGITEYVDTLKAKLAEAEKAYSNPKHKNSYMMDVIKELKDALQQVHYDDAKQEMQDLVTTTQRALTDMSRAWGIYKSVREATGNRELAARMAKITGIKSGITNEADALRNNISNAAPSVDFTKVYSLGKEELEKYVKSLGLPDKEIAGIIVKLEKWQELQRQLFEGDVHSFATLIGGLKDYDSLVKGINEKLKAQKESNNRLYDNRVITKEEKDKADNVAEVKAEAEIWRLSSQYVNLMNNSLSLTKTLLKDGVTNAQTKLNEEFKAGSISLDEYTQKMEELRKITSEYKQNSLFGANNSFTSYIRGGVQGVRNFYNGRINNAQRVLNDKKSTPEQRKAASDSIEKDKKELSKFDSGLVGTLGDLDAAFGALRDVLDPVINMFDQLGMKEVGEIFGGVQSAIGGAAQGATVGTALGELGGVLGNAGPYGAAIGAGLSILGSVGSAVFGNDNHAEQMAIQEEIKTQLEIISNSVDQIVSDMKESYGATALDKYNEAIEAVNKAQEQYWKGLEAAGVDNYGGGNSDWYHWNQNTRQMAKDIAKEYGISGVNSWQDLFSQLGSMENAEGARILNDIRLNHGNDWWYVMQTQGYNDGAMGDWLTKWADSWEELEDMVKSFREQMAGTSFDTVFDEFMDGLYEIANGSEDVFDDIATNWKKMINKMIVNNLIGQEVKEKLQDWYDNVFSPWYENGMVESKEEIFGQVDDIKENAINKTKALDTFDVSDESSSTSSKVIQGGFTEEETGLLLSYVNAIRADVSLNRVSLDNILTELRNQSGMPAIAQAQLQQLQTLVGLAKTRNDVIGQIYDILHKVNTGASDFKVR